VPHRQSSGHDEAAPNWPRGNRWCTFGGPFPRWAAIFHMMRWSWTQAAGQRICTRRVIQSKTGFVSIVAYGLGPTSKWRLSMSPLKTIAASAVAIALSLSAANAAEKPNIVQTAMSNGSFNTLVTAVKAAGLVDTLSGPGPFTVFAPTDDAFARLPNGTVEKLLKPENKKQLVAILTYHVVPGKVMSKDIAGKKTE